MSYRQTHPSLSWPPTDPQALAAFPRITLGSATKLFRVARAGRHPFWFGSSQEGRFDLSLPEGTCYLATDELAALLEVLGPGRTGGAVSPQFFAERRLFMLHVPAPQELADLTSRRAAGFGVTLEISTVLPYEQPQAWAKKLRQAGADGLAYRLRHDPWGSQGIALFGPHGERPWPHSRGQRIRDTLTQRLATVCGIAVLGIPRTHQLQVIDT